LAVNRVGIRKLEKRNVPVLNMSISISSTCTATTLQRLAYEEKPPVKEALHRWLFQFGYTGELGRDQV
jgi:hypothetical protein